MAVRLSVLLVQSSRMSGLQSGINAELVFQLMGVPGIDLSIVNSLNPAEIAETDRLLLSSLESDLAVLDWRDADDSLAALATLGVVGARAPHHLDPQTPAVESATRRIYLVDLRRGDSSSSVVSAMKQLLDQRRVVAVPLSIGGLAKQKQKQKSPADTLSTPAATGQSPPNTSAAGKQSPMDTGLDSGSSEPSDHDLDALVDGLNAADW